MGAPAIELDGLGKRYRLGATVGGYGRLSESLSEAAQRSVRRLRGEPVQARDARGHIDALKDVSLTIEQGEAVGLVGANGAGKSTLLKLLSRITEPTSGRAVLRGRVGSLLEVGAGFHPELTGRENIYLNGAILGMRKREISRRFDDIVEFAEVSQFLDTPVKRFSSGMFVRLAFAVAAHLEPDILLVDEVLAVGDAAFQRKSLAKMEDVAGEGRTVVFVSHNMALIQSLCSRAYLLGKGEVTFEGSARAAVRQYLDSLTSTVGVPVADRQDRRGDGSARIVALKIETLSSDGAIRTGSRLRITLDYESTGPLRRPRFYVSIYDTTRTGIYMLDSDTRGGLPDVLPERGRVTCLTGPIDVTPGVCYVNLKLDRGGAQADFVDNVATFDVEPEDVHSLGRVPPREWALNVIDQQWHGDADKGAQEDGLGAELTAGLGQPSRP